MSLGLPLLAQQGIKLDGDPAVRALAEGLVRDDLVIGHYSRAKKGVYRKHLTATGESIYSYPDFLARVPLYVILDLNRAIKGDSNEYVFITHNGAMGRDEFLAPNGSEWILVLKPAFDLNGNVISGIVDQHDLVKGIPFINKRTLYDVYRGKSGAICLSWPENADSYLVEPNHQTDVSLISDLILIYDYLKHSDGVTKISTSELQSLFVSLENPYGVAVAKEIFEEASEADENGVGPLLINGQVDKAGVGKSRDRAVKVEAFPEIGEETQESTAPKPAIEVSAEIVNAEPSEEPVEQTSNWWLWLIGLFVVVGGLAVVVRRKS